MFLNKYNFYIKFLIDELFYELFLINICILLRVMKENEINILNS